MNKKSHNLVFHLQYIDSNAPDNSIKFQTLKTKYDIETNLKAFPLCYLKEDQPKVVAEPTKALDEEDSFVSPMLGVQDNPVKVSDDQSKYLKAYADFFDQRKITNERSKEEIKRQFGLNDSSEYKEMLKNGVSSEKEVSHGFSLDTMDEELDEEIMAPIQPLYEETVESTYEYYDEEPVYTEEEVNVEEASQTAEEVERVEEVIEPIEEKDISEYFDVAPAPSPKPTPAPRVAPQPKVTPKVVTKRTKYMAPPINFLRQEPIKNTKDAAWAERQKETITSVFKEFHYGAKAVDYIIGPTVTLFLIDIDPGTDVSKLASFTKTLTMRLRATSLRIQDPIPGLGCAGVEIPNTERATVLTGSLMTKEFLQSEKKLKFVLGLNLNGEPVYGDIEKMPHGLVAGSTGSGKSVCINTMIISLIYHNTPDELRLILVDPKMVEFRSYDGIPHLAMPVITEPKKAVTAFRWACEEMDRRYEVFMINRVRDVNSFNSMQRHNGGRIMPKIVIIIDELADLIMVSGGEVEDYIMRLGQKARAAGIHVILATQRPSTDVIKGTLKNNIPTRIAFKVKSAYDSNTIIDHAGAEKLLGNGDMLFSNELGEERIQGSYVSDEEINAVCDYLINNNEAHYLVDEASLQEKVVMDAESDEDDEKFEEICYYAVRNGIGSANRLMQIFNISFNRANRILTKMERLGILSSTVKGKQREVLVSEEELASILDADK